MTAVDLAWQDRGACVGVNPDEFFPGKGDTSRTATARALCAHCPVRGECLAYALSRHEPYGIWGGTTPRERRILRRQLREDTAA